MDRADLKRRLRHYCVAQNEALILQNGGRKGSKMAAERIFFEFLLEHKSIYTTFADLSRTK